MRRPDDGQIDEFSVELDGPALGGLAMMFLGPQGFFWSLGGCLVILAAVSFAAHPAPAPTAPPVVRWRSPIDILEFDDCP